MLKAPVKLEDLISEWAIDSRIDDTEPAKETAKIPSLHSKYLSVLSYHNLVVKKLTADYAKLKAIKVAWYSGDLNNPEDLEKYNLEPMRKKIIRQDIGMHIESDQDLIDLLLKKALHQEIVDYATAIVKELSSRTYQLGNIIKFQIFTGGQ